MFIHRIATALAAIAVVLSASSPARATTTTYTWTGDSGLSASWYSAGNWGGVAPTDEPASDYVFTAGVWNATQTTIFIDGNNRAPDIDNLTFNGYANVPLTIHIGGTISNPNLPTTNYLYLDPSSEGATTISVAQTGVAYTIAGSSGASIQLGGDQQWSVDGTLQISATIWDDFESPYSGFTKVGMGTLTLSGNNNSFHGPITVQQGVLSVSSIGTTQGQAYNLGIGTLTLNGGTLMYTGVSGSTSRGFALGTGGGTIDVQNAATSLAFAGTVTGGQQGGLTKSGAGTLTLSAANTYGGLTTVAGGVLELTGTSLSAPGAWNPVLNLGGADLEAGGRLVFDYAGGSSPAATIESLLKASYDNGRWDTGKFQCPDAVVDGLTLGWLDNPAAQTLTVMATRPGDFNLDGVVDDKDRAIWFANTWTGTTWRKATPTMTAL